MNGQQTIPEWQQAILDKCHHQSGVWQAFPEPSATSSIADRFLQIVERFPDRLAVQSKDQRLTYRQLYNWANALACTIKQHSTDISCPVALVLGEGPETLVALLAVLLAGRFYTIVSLSITEDKFRYILQDSEASLIISTDKLPLYLKRAIPSVLPCLGIGPQSAQETVIFSPPVRVPLSAPVWLCYTTGSTGKPKGVIQTQENLLHFVRVDSDAMGICPLDRFSLLFAMNSNIAGHNIFTALLNGASLFLRDVRTTTPASTIGWLDANGITHLWTAPTLATHLFGSMQPDNRLQTLRVLQVVGETCRGQLFSLFRSHTSEHCILINRFGCSETGPLCRYFLDHTSTLDTEIIPIGYPVPGNEILFVDENRLPVAPGTEGEIVIRSRYLSPGYWNLPRQSAESFSVDPQDPTCSRYYTGDWGRMETDGSLLHMGRKDYEVKISGNKVHLQAVEVHLAEHPALAEVAVWPYLDGEKTQRLAAYIVCKPGYSVTDSVLRAFLLERVPAYAIPTRFERLERMPTASNGKLYRPALPPPTHRRPQLDNAYAPPVTPVERLIACLWREVLVLDEIGIHDPFLDLGGNSLQAMRIAARVQEEFGLEIPLVELFAAGTVTEMALAITAHLAASAGLREQFLLDGEPDVQFFTADI